MKESEHKRKTQLQDEIVRDIVRERVMSEKEKHRGFFFFFQVVFLIYFEVKI